MGPPGLLGAQGGAAWLASHASRAFSMTEAGDIHATCDIVFRHLEAQFERHKTRAVTAAWEIPKAAFGLAQLTEDHLSVAWAADSPILLISGDTARWCTGTPDTSAETAEALALGPGIGAATALSGDALEDRRAHRARADHVALSPYADASASVTRYAHHPVSAGDEVLLMTDGFASLVTDYHQYTAQELARAVRSKGLCQLAQDIRRIEQEDAACLRYPRFKVSDDATALWVKITG